MIRLAPATAQWRSINAHAGLDHGVFMCLKRASQANAALPNSNLIPEVGQGV